MTSPLTRVVEPDGSVTISADKGRFHFRRTRPGLIEVTIVGQDDGQFGTTTLDELRLALMRERPLELFIDARDAFAPVVSVSNDWTRFFSDHRHDLKRVSVLVGSKAVELTIAVAQHLSRTGHLIQIYSDPEAFEFHRLTSAQGR